MLFAGSGARAGSGNAVEERWGALVLPDPQRQLRRLTKARPVSRAVTHVAVIGLVAFATAFGYVATRPASGADLDSASLLPFDLVARVRGADSAAAYSRGSTFDLQPDPNRPDPMLQRRVIQTPPAPLPTPVPPPPPAPDPPMVATGGVAVAPQPVVKVGSVVGTGVLGWPVNGTITTYFSAYHLAIDIAAPYGTTVKAADGGVVTWAGWRNNGGGLVIAIDHGNGITTLYNHLGTIFVGPGEAVAKGQAIAGVGCTGVCTGPHVHFEVIVNGVLVNPLRYL
jgi:murein DD-endopeptidase MepM/ murein hydrolase activator NlpD